MSVLRLINLKPSRLRVSFTSLSLAAHRFAERTESGAPRPQALLLIGRKDANTLALAIEIHSGSIGCDNTFVRLPCDLLPTGREFHRLMFGGSQDISLESPRLPGELRLTSGGTLYLDDVNLLAEDSQQDLFSALDTQQVFPVGASGSIAIDVQTIASVDADLIDRSPEECVLVRVPICALAAFLKELRVLGGGSRVQGIFLRGERGAFAHRSKGSGDYLRIANRP